MAGISAAGHTPPRHWPGECPNRAAHDIARGVIRLLSAHGFFAVAEVTLPNGLRADVVGLSPKGDVRIVEIKSSLADFRSDSKWRGYRPYCDELYFAVADGFPLDVLPPEAGRIVADRYGGEIADAAPYKKVSAAARKAVTLRFARCAASRLTDWTDPDFFREIGAWRS